MVSSQCHLSKHDALNHQIIRSITVEVIENYVFYRGELRPVSFINFRQPATSRPEEVAR
jgi:hypothetical protein